MAQKPNIPKGTRDFNAEDVAKRSYIMEIIKKQFLIFGFQPIETPSFENSDTLMGKYGDEGDRLIFKILNSGDYFKDVIGSVTDLAKFTIHFSEIFEAIKQIVKFNPNFDDYNNTIVEILSKYSNLNHIEKKLLETFYIKNKELVLNFSKKKFDNPNNFLEDSAEAINFKRNLFSSIYDKYISKFEVLNSNKVAHQISEKALRYDLTVPFARYVVQHQNGIVFPFKRYQMQPVWRADRPQKGRFREFYQCDADVVGSKSLLQEVEFVQLYDAVFSTLKLEGLTIKINNRKILSGIAEIIGAQDKLIDFTVALDKLDKIGEEKVKEEMRSKGISEIGISKLQPLFSLEGNFDSQIEHLKSILNTSETGLKGIEELEFINNAISAVQLKTATLQLDVTLARGLNYYTGAIFEVSAPEDVKMGSIGGGGRYDNLTDIFGLKDISGVGISFGLDRIYLVLEELNLFPETIAESTKVMFINFGDKEAMTCLKTVTKLRNLGIKSELYPDASKMKKQMVYANRRNIPYVVLVGEQELESKTFALKNMESGKQQNVSYKELTDILLK